MGLVPQLVIFGKWPRAGQVKTRLAADIGTGAALQFYRTNLNQTVQRLARDARWHTTLALGNIADVANARAVWPAIHVEGQGGGDLGARMTRQFSINPPGPVVIIGSDIPDITAGDIASAFAVLGDHDCVFGPAPDGGYWLVGARRRPNVISMFDDVRWSSPHALADTMANLHGKSIARLGLKADIDNGDDFLAYRSERRGRISTKLQG